MTRRLVLSYLAITVVVLVLLEVPLAVFFEQRETERLTVATERDATVLATFYEDALERDGTVDPTTADEYSARTGARVVVVDERGVSQVDTELDPPRDFSTRPEIVSALDGRHDTGIRRSDTLGTDLLYVAVPVASGGVVHGALRLTIDAADVSDRVAGFRIGLVMIAAIILVAMAGMGWIVARSVTRPIRHLQHAAGRFAAGDLTPGDPARGAPSELVELERTMNSMAGRLDELLSTQRAFVADASHQLRTPLTALRLRLENVAAACTASGAATPETTATDSGDLRDEIDDALAETERLGSLVDDLLALARAERPAAAEPTAVARLAADRVDTWSAVADEHDVAIELTAPDRTLEALAVPGAVEQILDNLLDNALRFSPPGSTITVDVRALPSGRVALRVGDQGPGLDAEQWRQATDRFWRGQQPVGTAAETSGGSGLGLAIVQALAIASGGDVRLEAGTDDPAADGRRGLAVITELPGADQTVSAPEAPPTDEAASQRRER